MPAKAIACILLLALSAGLLISIRPRSAWDEVAEGEAALFHGNVFEAIAHFNDAVQIQPSADVRMRVGTDLADEVCGHSESTLNTEAMADAALTHLTAVVREDRRNSRALLKVGEVLTWRGHRDDAIVYYRMSAEADSRDALAHFRLAVRGWEAAYQQRASFLAARHLKYKTNIVNSPECQELAVLNKRALEDGLSHLRTAIELRHEDPDPLLYFAAFHRELAEIRCGDPSSRNIALQQAAQYKAAYCDQRRRQSYSPREYLSEPSAGAIASCSAAPGDYQYISPQ